MLPSEYLLGPNAPEMNPELKEMVDEIIKLMAERKLQFQQAYKLLFAVKEELNYRSTFLHL